MTRTLIVRTTSKRTFRVEVVTHVRTTWDLGTIKESISRQFLERFEGLESARWLDEMMVHHLPLRAEET